MKYYVLAALLAAAAVRPGVLTTGLLDPIPMMHRSVTLVVLPLADARTQAMAATPRLYEWSWLIGGVFLAAVAANFFVPRFYCRFVCPLGAMLGVLGRFALFRIGKAARECSQCGLCETDCEGACNPSGQIRAAECVLCCNCLHACNDRLMRYQRAKSAAGERTNPDVSRRGVLLSLVAGAAAAPLVRLAGGRGSNWNSAIIRPPGALDEERFLQRCIRCGQCMKICPTNVIQPGGLQAGLETLWTPMLNNRIGTSGCQLLCVACCSVCPTAAIRPISLDEKLGRGRVRLGRADPAGHGVRRSRAVPAVGDGPAVHRLPGELPGQPQGHHRARAVQHHSRRHRPRPGRPRDDGGAGGVTLRGGELGTGDYYLSSAATGACRSSATTPRRSRSPRRRSCPRRRGRGPGPPSAAGRGPRACIGCGVCEHECPVSGLRAIRVTAENESRSRKHSLLL